LVWIDPPEKVKQEAASGEIKMNWAFLWIALAAGAI
jgi:hypothetical protein